MSAVLVYGERIEVPEGWIVVCTGYAEPGDRQIERDTESREFRWRQFGDYVQGLNCSVSYYPLVIRRDSSATEKP